MSVTAVVPGSFDPIHVGHLDVVRRVAARFDQVVVAVLANPSKSGLFPVEQRLELIRAEVADLSERGVEHGAQVEVASFEGLLVDFCRERDIGVIAKGVRSVGDVEYELQMAQMNQRMAGVETLFLSTSPEHSYLSSSLIKDIARWGGPLTGMVPPAVESALRDHFAA